MPARRPNRICFSGSSRNLEKPDTDDVCRQPRLQTAELMGRLVMNACMQPGECLQALRYEARILSHALRKRSLLYTVEYDTPASGDLKHAPDCRNRKRHRLYCRVDRRLAECRGFSRRGAIMLHGAKAPLEYLGHVSVASNRPMVLPIVRPLWLIRGAYPDRAMC
jgi:hypothetical protein